MKKLACVAAALLLAGCGGNGGPPPPVGISSITPDRGTNAGGTPVTITGWGFSLGTVQVTFAGSNASGITVNSDTEITCNTPSYGTNAWVAVVVTADTESATRSNGFYYFIPPNITSVNPTSGPSAGGTEVTIDGTGFLAGAAVTFGVNPATDVAVTATQITCRTPASAVAGAVDVTVANADGGSDTHPAAFTYRLPPNITDVSPAYADAAGGATITITGTDFYGNTSNTIVRIGATNVTPASVGATTVTFVVPAGLAVGTYDVTFVNPDEQSDTAPAALYLYDAANTIFVSTTGDDATGDGSLGNPYRTIGKGVQAAVSGKTVFALSGSYTTESWPVAMKAGVTVIGESRTGTVVNAGASANAALSFNAVSGAASRLERLTVTGGAPAAGYGVVINNSSGVQLVGIDVGGRQRGVEMSSSIAAVDKCRIHDNLTRGGLKALASDVTITDTVFDGNTEEQVTGGGAGAYFDEDCTVDISRCVFSNNDAASGSIDRPGGGIYISGVGSIVNCLFYGNSASIGGGILIYDVPATPEGDAQLFIKNCIFYGNSASNPSDTFVDGSAAALVASARYATGTEFVNCVFADNVSSAQGSTILGYTSLDRQCRPTLRNCVIYG
ncbi:MAG TPA: DUF1565 domain-containing protein, partial [Planctomycetes bacterium]|nr:DUF1565 domain-containing protein [Planctomycetota bacterium]